MGPGVTVWAPEQRIKALGDSPELSDVLVGDADVLRLTVLDQQLAYLVARRGAEQHLCQCNASSSDCEETGTGAYSWFGYLSRRHA